MVQAGRGSSVAFVACALAILILVVCVNEIAVAADPPPASGYVVKRLPLPADVLPSSLAVRSDGTLMVASMDGEVLRAEDSDGDGLPDRYVRWAGTLPHWPLGMRFDGHDLLLATRGALLRLSDRDGDGRAERWVTLGDAWDVSRDHHDWTTGVVPWPGSEKGWVVCPVTDDTRDRDVAGRHYLRGKALRIGADGSTQRPRRGAPVPDRLGRSVRPTARSSSPITRGSRRRPARSTGWSAAAGTATRARPTHPSGPGLALHRADRPDPLPVGPFGQRPAFPPRRGRQRLRAARRASSSSASTTTGSSCVPASSPWRGRSKGRATRSWTVCSARSVWRSPPGPIASIRDKACFTSAASASRPGEASPSKGRSIA